MSKQQHFDAGRRDFLCRMSLMGAALFTASLLPPMARALAEPALANWRGKSAGNYTFMDEALGNYPAYAADIGFGRGHLAAGEPQSLPDGQFLV